MEDLWPNGVGPVVLTALLIGAAAYFCGCWNGAVIVSKYVLGNDVRKHGSGNAGLTNFYRTFGGPLTLVVILTDVLKAVVAIGLGVWFQRQCLGAEVFGPLTLVLAKYWAGMFCLLGHMFPVMFHFKGGKGILSGGTIALMLDWRIALVVWGGFLLLVLLTRYVSLGSIWAGASFPVATWFVYHSIPLTLLGLVTGGLIVYMHRGNLQRLLQGTEHKFHLGREKK